MSDHIPSSSETAMIMQEAQHSYLLRGGAFVHALARLRAQGVIAKEGQYVFHEYPKMLHIHRGTEVIHRTAEDVKGKLREWDETVQLVDDILVHSEEEEDRVVNGGKTASQIEADRQTLLGQAKARGVRFDPAWSTLRLQRELGVEMASDKPVAFDELSALREQVDRLEEAARLRARIAELEAETAMLAPSDEVEDMRAQLRTLDVHVDLRWGALRLKQELDRATAPKEA